MKTVLFGPFIGELGWELLWWQGWVRKVCRTTYADYRRIAVSLAGREPFYPYVDEFWPLPEEISVLLVSQRNYITDYWKNGLPQAGGFPVQKMFLGLRLQRKQVSAVTLPDIEPQIAALIDSCKKRISGEVIVHCPCYLNRFEPDGFSFGVSCPERPRSEREIRPYKIPLEQQLLEPLAPTERGVREFDRLFPEGHRLIAIFPRDRKLRRPDKNWPREKYNGLIRVLQKEYPHHRVAILGDPMGAHYGDGVPEGCVDLVNCPAEMRLDLQVSALARCDLALGSFSGAILMALACRCPAVTWGYRDFCRLYHDENYLSTPLVYYPFLEATIDQILGIARRMMAGDRPSEWDPDPNDRSHLRPKSLVRRVWRRLAFRF